jgi:riboflavin kinase/FMN adenylyltransferase
MSAAVSLLGMGEWLAVERKPRAVTIGNFDGVHRGHRSLLAALDRYAQAHPGVAKCAVTFFPHPATVVAPDRAPRLLLSLEERVRWLRRLGADEVLVLQFDLALSRMSAAAFARDLLAEALQAQHVVIGENFRFGNGQEGNLSQLQALGTELGFQVEGLPLATWRGLPVSSSEIRRRLREGDALRVARLLGRPHSLCGPVVRGRGVGGKQTVPTLNLAPTEEALPADGVYVTRTFDEAAGAVYPSITNIGYRPTFDDGHPERSIETFLLGPLVAQPSEIRVEFLRRVRGERKFDSPEALRAQILRDVATAQAFHRRLLRWQPPEMALSAQ